MFAVCDCPQIAYRGCNFAFKTRAATAFFTFARAAFTFLGVRDLPPRSPKSAAIFDTVASIIGGSLTQALELMQ